MSGLGLNFLDADGRKWIRTEEGGLQEVNVPESWILDDGGRPSNWATAKYIKVKALSECGQATHPNQ
ncbi:hypothetical protein [Streptomyces asiaticus]|uniref:hypothetical protein n=1 Tax=Streptomyces asiaticus TaxID=114695 RepID=UPI003F67DFC0